MIVRRSALIATILVVTVVVAAALWQRRSKPAGPAEPEAFSHTADAVDSPDLRLEVEEVTGRLHADAVAWSCRLICREPAGCRAELRVTVHYLSDGGPEQVLLFGEFDGPEGSSGSVAGVQRPPVEVAGVERVEIAVIRLIRDSDPSPTPMI
jgi:hypothetical protein